MLQKIKTFFMRRRIQKLRERAGESYRMGAHLHKQADRHLAISNNLQNQAMVLEISLRHARRTQNVRA